MQKMRSEKNALEVPNIIGEKGVFGQIMVSTSVLQTYERIFSFFFSLSLSRNEKRPVNQKVISSVNTAIFIEFFGRKKENNDLEMVIQRQ